jgi:hypothetical protein
VFITEAIDKQLIGISMTVSNWENYLSAANAHRLQRHKTD